MSGSCIILSCVTHLSVSTRYDKDLMLPYTRLHLSQQNSLFLIFYWKCKSRKTFASYSPFFRIADVCDLRRAEVHSIKGYLTYHTSKAWWDHVTLYLSFLKETKIKKNEMVKVQPKSHSSSLKMPSSCGIYIGKMPQICPKIHFLVDVKTLSFLNCYIMDHLFLAKIYLNVG